MIVLIKTQKYKLLSVPKVLLQIEQVAFANG